MTAEELSKIVDQSLNSVDLEKLKEVKDGSAKDQIFAIFKLLSGDFVGAIESQQLAISDYREGEFFRKFCRYVMELVETTAEQRHKFSQEVQEKAQDFSGNVIFGIVDRLDNINKESVLARLTIARINRWISIEDFFRLSSMLERIPFIDLNKLPYYKEPYYDESGDSELLYATGALEIKKIGYQDSNEYVLSKLGEKLVIFGLAIQLNMQREKGTNIVVHTMTPDDVDEMTKRVLGNSHQMWRELGGDARDDDSAQFEYDRYRGK